MPRPQDLPEDLLPLARRHALELSDLRWKHDVDQLVGTLEKILAEAGRAGSDLKVAEPGRREVEEPAADIPAAAFASLMLVGTLLR